MKFVFHSHMVFMFPEDFYYYIPTKYCINRYHLDGFFKNKRQFYVQFGVRLHLLWGCVRARFKNTYKPFYYHAWHTWWLLARGQRLFPDNALGMRLKVLLRGGPACFKLSSNVSDETLPSLLNLNSFPSFLVYKY